MWLVAQLTEVERARSREISTGTVGVGDRARGECGRSREICEIVIFTGTAPPEISEIARDCDLWCASEAVIVIVSATAA